MYQGRCVMGDPCGTASDPCTVDCAPEFHASLSPGKDPLEGLRVAPKDSVIETLEVASVEVF